MQKQARQQKQAKPTELMYCAFNQVSSYSTRVLLAFACALLIIGAAFAQSTTDGAIGGTVVDNTGAVVARAKVVTHNEGTNAEKTAETDSSGYYRVIQLQPGNYTVSINQSGFAPFKASQVAVQVGSLTQVSAHLAVAGTVETVQVSGEQPQINYVSADFAPALNQTSIQNLPINGGRWSSFSLLTPGVVSDSNGFGLVSFRGISTLLNNNTVDGADNNQAFFSEERGRTRAGYSTPKVAIQEFQVNTSNYSSEYGRSAGGVTNTVTRSGGNDLHGEAYFYDRDAGWGAANAFTKIPVQDPTTGIFNLKNFKPKDWRKMTGFGVGGPIIKDKLFFFLAFDYYIRNFPGTAVANNPNVFLAAPSATALNTLATRLGVTSAQAATIYNNDLFGTTTAPGLISMLGPVPRTGEQNIFFPKIDWQITPKHHAAFTFNRMRWSSPAGIQTQSTNTFGRASFGDDFVKDTWGVAKLNSLLTSNIVNELRYQYGRDFEFEFTQKPTPYELTNLVNVNTPFMTYSNPLGLPPQVSITNGFTFGVPSFLQRPAFPDETRHQIADTVSWTHGNHNIKFGVDFSRVNDNSKNLRNQFGSISYSSLLAYFSDLNRPNTCAGRPCYNSFTQALGPLGFEFQTDDIAFFAQDDWKILPRLSLSLGIRYENQMLPSPFSSLVNPLAPGTAHMPSDTNNFGPRIGFSFDVFGDAKTVLRGGYGLYYGRIINSTIYNALTQTAMPGSQLSFTLNPTNSVTGPCAPAFPQILTGPPTCLGAKPSIVFFGRNFQNPQIHQTDLTLEHDLGWNTVLSISYLGSLGRELPNFEDTNICTSAAIPGCGSATTSPRTVTYTVLGGGPITAGTFTEPLFVGRPDANFGATSAIVSNINSSYNALVVQANHRMSHHVQFSANYTWSHAIDFGQNQSTFSDTNDLLFPGNLTFEKANSIYDVRHRFVAHAVMTSPWKVDGWAGILANDWEFDPVYQVQKGLPYSLSTSGTPGIVTGTPGVDAALLGGIGSNVNGSGGANRVEFIGRDTFRQPNTWVADARVAKHFKIRERYGLEVMADFFNLANKQNVTGVTSTGYFIANPSVNPITHAVSPCATGVPITSSCITFNAPFSTITNSNSNFTYSPRQIQLGIRVKF